MKKSTILLIELQADLALSTSIRAFLTGFGYELHVYEDVAAVVEGASDRGLPRLALINMAQGRLRGLAAAQRLKTFADLPILFIYPADSKSLNIEDLRRYADDFLVRPFGLPELEARLQIMLARMPKLLYARQSLTLVDNHLSIDFAQDQAIVGGRPIKLTPTESLLLHTLLHSAPRVVANQTLITRVWVAEGGNQDTLRVHIHRLRRKLEMDAHRPHYIRTERSVGYRFTQRPVGWEEDEDPPAAD